MNKHQFALHNLYSFSLSDFEEGKENLMIQNENYRLQLDTLKELVDKASNLLKKGGDSHEH
jgi:hypothetical protein|uniref:Uncharacterized protein n=1 Tax=Myoviridae sp. ct78050 TaxID=2826617 RepID=A0A8S5R1K0_9CAUD|nr:MAG TPA: hypothetical protein [Myoviridae sp. ct78050]